MSKGGFLARVRSAFGLKALHPIPTSPDYIQYPATFRLPYSKTEYTPEEVPQKEHRDLSSIGYWRHAAGKRTRPMARKPDVLKEQEKEHAALSSSGPVRVGGPEDITQLRFTRPPGERIVFTSIPNEIYQ